MGQQLDKTGRKLKVYSMSNELFIHMIKTIYPMIPLKSLVVAVDVKIREGRVEMTVTHDSFDSIPEGQSI